jgi:hypothetical protein
MQSRSEVNMPVFRDTSRLAQVTFPVTESGLSRLVVTDVMDDVIIIQGLDGGPLLRSSCSASCLLNPLPGDLVLVHLDHESQAHFVLSVLKQSAQRSRSYALGKEVSLLTDGSHLHIKAHAINLTATESEFRIERFQGIYQDKSERANTITVVANLVRHQIDRMIAKIRNSFRLIDGLDRTQAANIQHTAEHQILLKSSFTKLHSQHAVKVDAKKIDLG